MLLWWFCIHNRPGPRAEPRKRDVADIITVNQVLLLLVVLEPQHIRTCLNLLLLKHGWHQTKHVLLAARLQVQIDQSIGQVYFLRNEIRYGGFAFRWCEVRPLRSTRSPPACSILRNDWPKSNPSRIVSTNHSDKDSSNWRDGWGQLTSTLLDCSATSFLYCVHHRPLYSRPAQAWRCRCLSVSSKPCCTFFPCSCST